MDAKLGSALIALAGAGVGIIVRDVFMALLTASAKREQELKDRAKQRAQERVDLVRLYADPLRIAARALKFRLNEIIDHGPARYLLAETIKTSFVEYKRISTLYRLAALLGWIRAFRRERAYLDPEARTSDELESSALESIEKALADGQHVELQRLDELLDLWKVSAHDGLDAASKSRMASEIDAIRQEFLTKRDKISTSDL
jgi:hypothetical protein